MAIKRFTLQMNIQMHNCRKRPCKNKYSIVLNENTNSTSFRFKVYVC